MNNTAKNEIVLCQSISRRGWDASEYDAFGIRLAGFEVLEADLGKAVVQAEAWFKGSRVVRARFLDGMWVNIK